MYKVTHIKNEIFHNEEKKSVNSIKIFMFHRRDYKILGVFIWQK